MWIYWSLNDSKSPKVPRTFLGILADLNNAVIWTVSTRPVISKSLYHSFGDCTKSTNYNWYNCYFRVQQFFLFPSKVVVLIPLFAFFQFTLWSVGTAKSTILQVLFFCWLSLGLVVWPRLGDPFISQNSKGVRVSQGQILGCAYTICSYG